MRLEVAFLALFGLAFAFLLAGAPAAGAFCAVAAILLALTAPDDSAQADAWQRNHARRAR